MLFDFGKINIVTIVHNLKRSGPYSFTCSACIKRRMVSFDPLSGFHAATVLVVFFGNDSM